MRIPLALVLLLTIPLAPGCAWCEPAPSLISPRNEPVSSAELTPINPPGPPAPLTPGEQLRNAAVGAVLLPAAFFHFLITGEVVGV